MKNQETSELSEDQKTKDNTESEHDQLNLNGTENATTDKSQSNEVKKDASSVQVDGTMALANFEAKLIRI